MYELYNMIHVNGAECVRRVRRLGRERGIVVRFDERRGKGSHGRLYYGDQFTTVPDRKMDVRPGLLRAMLRDLGLKPEEI